MPLQTLIISKLQTFTQAKQPIFQDDFGVFVGVLCLKIILLRQNGFYPLLIIKHLQDFA